MARDFRTIDAWRKADDLAVLVYEITQQCFPAEERYGLISQMRRAAVSVAANIAEGAGRQYLKEFLQFLYRAKGSLSELEYYIHLALRLGYLNSQQHEMLRSSQRDTAATLIGYIRYIEKLIRNGQKYT